MPAAAKSNTVSSVTLDELQAGYLVYGDSRSNRDFALFEVTEAGDATFVRVCTKPEEKWLEKLLHGQNAVKRISGHLVGHSGNSCELFIYKQKQ